MASKREILETVFAEVLERVDTLEGTLDRVEIRHATPTEYPCRIYIRGDEDFEGVMVTVPA